MAKKESKTVKVLVKSEREDIPKELQLYLFDNDGELLETSGLKNGVAELKTNAEGIKGKAQIIFGPPIPEEFKGRKISPLLIKKMGGYQPSLRLNRNYEIIISGLPKFKFPNWDWCLITGNLSKSFTIDGENKILPVCDARVHICEIDRIKWWWPKIPRLVLDDLGKKLKEVIIDPEIILPRLRDTKLIDTELPEITRLRSATDKLKKHTLIELPDRVKQGLLSTSQTIVHETIFNNFQLLHPYICFWPWFWPYFYHCDHIATVYSDCNGNFDFNYLNFTNDKDIYIWVEVNINGEWVTVYRPPIACYTRWNYNCGTDINIRITDSRVRPCECEPLPGAVVWMKRVNTGVSLRSIQQSEVSSGHLANAVGLTWYGNTGNRVSPFGKVFPLVVQFGSGFPNSTVTHYRWSHRRLKDAFLTNVSDSNHMIEGNISKSYTYEVVTSGGTVFATGSFPLGPSYDAGKPKFKIPHVEASVDVPAEPTAEWNQDTNSVKIDTPTKFSDGLYEFTFELLNSSGNVVPVAPNTFVVDRISSDPAGPATIFADGLAENYIVKNSAGNAIAFRFKMRIDNQDSYANVLDALVDGNPTDTECGIGHYNNKMTDKAILNFIAGHPQDFATYVFRVTKGNSNPVAIANTSGYVNQLNNGYVTPNTIDDPKLVPSIPAKHQQKKEMDVSAMLGACNMAAFAEVLHVYATHTDGSNRINDYDSGDTAAIAIATP